MLLTMDYLIAYLQVMWAGHRNSFVCIKMPLVMNIAYVVYLLWEQSDI
jgi:hypothetical protein